jgi:hypothetical protein
MSALAKDFHVSKLAGFSAGSRAHYGIRSRPAATASRNFVKPTSLISLVTDERRLLAHPTLSAYGRFLAHSARTGSNPGTRASGRKRLESERTEPHSGGIEVSRPMFGEPPARNFLREDLGRWCGRPPSLLDLQHARLVVKFRTVRSLRSPCLWDASVVGGVAIQPQNLPGPHFPFQASENNCCDSVAIRAVQPAAKLKSLRGKRRASL